MANRHVVRPGGEGRDCGRNPVVAGRALVISTGLNHSHLRLLRQIIQAPMISIRGRPVQIMSSTSTTVPEAVVVSLIACYHRCQRNCVSSGTISATSVVIVAAIHDGVRTGAMFDCGRGVVVHSHQVVKNGILLKKIVGVAHLKLVVEIMVAVAVVMIRSILLLLAPNPLAVRVMHGEISRLLEGKCGPAVVVSGCGGSSGSAVVADGVGELRTHVVIVGYALSIYRHLRLLDIFQPLRRSSNRQCAALQYRLDVVSAHVEVRHRV